MKGWPGSDRERPCKLLPPGESSSTKTPVDGISIFCANIVATQELIIQCLKFERLKCFLGTLKSFTAGFSVQKLTLTTSSA